MQRGVGGWGQPVPMERPDPIGRTAIGDFLKNDSASTQFNFPLVDDMDADLKPRLAGKLWIVTWVVSYVPAQPTHDNLGCYPSRQVPTF